ncbi:hypothetical protein sr17069 [Sporisorium reilianum SRZ2]|uniref:Uncharacterized protein n=1 Tax=Sporisorium reilianum (strain SRZ2) TaxID=999809 RepID=E7A0Z4_SPORE|nr:hypothetical protein sr17069 [Sporisorium reilianum SRZ2]
MVGRSLNWPSLCLFCEEGPTWQDVVDSDEILMRSRRGGSCCGALWSSHVPASVSLPFVQIPVQAGTLYQSKASCCAVRRRPICIHPTTEQLVVSKCRLWCASSRTLEFNLSFAGIVDTRCTATTNPTTAEGEGRREQPRFARLVVLEASRQASMTPPAEGPGSSII